MGQHARLPAWGRGHKTHVKLFDFPPQYVALAPHYRGWIRHGFNLGPFVSSKKRASEWEGMKDESKRDSGKWICQETDGVVPKMSQHWKWPVISPADGFRVHFSSCKLSGYAWACNSPYVYLYVWRRMGQEKQEMLAITNCMQYSSCEFSSKIISCTRWLMLKEDWLFSSCFWEAVEG